MNVELNRNPELGTRNSELNPTPHGLPNRGTSSTITSTAALSTNPAPLLMGAELPNLERQTLNSGTGTWNPKLGTRNPELETRNSKPGTRNPGTRNPEPETRNPEPGTNFMICHPPLSSLIVTAPGNDSLQPFLDYLESMDHVSVTKRRQLPDDLGEFDVVVTADTSQFTGNTDNLEQFVRSGRGWIGLAGHCENRLPKIFGVEPMPIGPVAEIRVMFSKPNHPLSERMGDAMYVSGPFSPLRQVESDAELLLYADWHYRHVPVMTCRRVGEGIAACTTLKAFSHPDFQQILYRLMRRMATKKTGHNPLGTAILGYAPSVGQAHGKGIEATSGLVLNAACDMNPDRRQQAEIDFPGLKTVESSDDLAEDPDIDLVIIATPPNTHAELCLQMMEAGKHVVCEKPLALNCRETSALVNMADQRHVHLSCHQNRRWDVDYLAIRQALAEGQIGELFYLETFVGNFSHPCGYWHSHEAVSGGTAYDWGAHYLDWIVSLIPDRPEAVCGSRHNRVWHDVTNADQERVQIRFAGGQEAEFVHSDIAAARKPKWYLLGTEGALVGHWVDVPAFEIDPIVYFHRRDIPITEMPPDLTLFRRHHTGQIVPQKLAVPDRHHFMFHRNLADHLLTGEPIAAPLDDSVAVVAILEAASRSAGNGGRWEILHG